MLLSVIIVSYNVKDYLWQCLTSLRKSLKDIDAEVIVFDNHSHDETIKCLQPQFKDVKFISSNHNLGFAKGNNHAIRLSKGKYVLLLNPDTIVAENTIRSAIAFMETHPKAGGAGARMTNADGTDAKESRRGIPTPLTALFKFTGLCSRFPQGKHTGRYYMGWLPWDKEARIEIISGAFFLIRRAALEQIGLLDESFFMYGEDVDLSYRLLKGGWENWYLPLRILHYKGESTQKSSFRYVHVFYKAMLIFCKKHYKGMGRLLLPFLGLAVNTKAMIALCAVAFKKTRKNLGFVDDNIQDSFFIIHVSASNMKKCQQLVSEKGLWAEFHDANTNFLKTTLPRQEGPRTYITFDSSAFSYSDILSAMHDYYGTKAFIAVYHPDEDMIITDHETFKS